VTAPKLTAAQVWAPHEIAERNDPLSRMSVCSCGWFFRTARRNGAWMKVKRAIRLHREAINAGRAALAAHEGSAAK
jgi:hypothetical protein